MLALLHGLLWATALPPPTTVVSLPNSVKVSHATQPLDGHTLLILLSRAGPDQTNAIRRALPLWLGFDLIPMDKDKAELFIYTKHRLVSHKVKRRGNSYSLHLWTESPAHRLTQRLMQPLPRSVPSAFLAPRVAKPEKRLRAGQWLEAERLFEKMRKEIALEPWALLRLGDTALLRGNEIVACRRYADLRQQFATRSVALVAALRMHVLACPARGLPQIPWQLIVSRVRYLASPIGAYLWRETLWTLAESREPEDLQFALSLPPASSRAAGVGKLARGIPTRTRDALVPRTTRRKQSAMERAATCLRYDTLYRRHVEVRSLMLRCARAFLELDLWSKAVDMTKLALRRKGKAPAFTLWKARKGEAQLYRTLALGYRTAGEDLAAVEIEADYAKRFKGKSIAPAETGPRAPKPKHDELEGAIAAMEDRLETLKAVAQALGGLPE